MKQKPWSILLILIGIIIISCNKKEETEPNNSTKNPIAAFSYTGNDGPAPVDIQFTNYSETIIEDKCSYEWTFGTNGPQSTEKNPMHTFYNNSSSSKIVLVSLRVLDLESNLSQTKSVRIEILPAQ